MVAFLTITEITNQRGKADYTTDKLFLRVLTKARQFNSAELSFLLNEATKSVNNPYLLARKKLARQTILSLEHGKELLDAEMHTLELTKYLDFIQRTQIVHE